MKQLFYAPLKIKAKSENILFWGCLHYDHECKHWDNPLWKMRGFNSLKDHNDTLIERWNNRASNDNTIGFLLGDTMFGSGGKEKFLNILKSLNFKELYVLAGNHTAGYKQLFESITGNDLEFDGKKVIFCPNYFEVFINKKPVIISHYPILSFNGQARGSIHLFSHVHGSLNQSKIGRLYENSGAKIYETSVEKNSYPITLKTLLNKFDKIEPISFDQHRKTDKNPL